ncbi:MAG: phosphatidate cytidylyltransferase [Alphaproteobacteria bacterium]
MNGVASERLWAHGHALDHPATVLLLSIILVAFALAVGGIGALSLSSRIKPELKRELRQRTVSWSILVVLLGVPVLAGAGWTMLAVLVIALLCYREYARATGLFRERAVSAAVVVAILFIFFATVDHWYGFFLALVPLGVVVIAAISIPLDRPTGYIQRVGLGVFGYLLFGVALGHLAFIANDGDYRPVILLILIAVGLNDVFAFTVGKIVGGRKLLPATSPNKTVSGSIGALMLTTTFVSVVAGPVFAGTALESIPLRIGLGVIVALLGQLGDLMLSSIKRDLGIKDMGTVIPGHGGVLDRFNSLLLVAPAVFHYIRYFNGIGLDQPARILSGG